MKSWKLGSSVFWAASLALLLSGTAQAQEEPQRPELPELKLEGCPDVAELEVGVPLGDQTGAWMPRTTLECLYGRLRLLEELIPYVTLLEARADRADARASLQRRETALAAQEADSASEALDEAVERAREATDDLNAWHRARALWFSLGVVVTVVLEAVAIWAFNELRL